MNIDINGVNRGSSSVWKCNPSMCMLKGNLRRIADDHIERLNDEWEIRGETRDEDR